jgi:hypothetical protein
VIIVLVKYIRSEYVDSSPPVLIPPALHNHSVRGVVSVVLLKSHFYRKIVHQNEKLFHSATNIAGSEVPVTYAMYNEYQ